MTDAALTFLSWTRRGLGTAISTEATATTTQVQVTVNFATNAEVLQALPTLSLIGPGDIVGLDQSIIVRAWPPPDELDAEFVSYPLIEFDQADLPWRCAKANPTAK